MKKTYIFLIVAALCAFGVSAKSIYIWRNGVKTELPIQTNDSITFEEGSAPTMRIWRNGSEIYELALAVDDSITYSQDAPVTPATATTFDYDHWREQTVIRMYDKENYRWVNKYLPWKPDISSVTMPESYRYPNKEFHVDSQTNDSTPIWELAFNLFSDSIIDDGYMFGLWNKKSQTMRIYSYIDQLPNENASYCFYYVNTSTPCFIEPDAKAFMPSDSVLRRSNSWNASAISNADARPSTTDNIVQPIQRDKGMPINSGWVCFEMKLSSGHFSLPEDGTISFSMIGVEQISFEGTDSLGLALQCDSCIGTQTGQIVTPPNKAKQAGGILNSIGSFFKGIVSTAAAAVSIGTNQTVNESKYGFGTAVIGGLGALCDAGGMFANGYAEDDTIKSTLSTTLNLTMGFHGSAEGHFEGQLSSQVGTHTGGLTLSYRKFFEEILNHANKNQQAPMRRSNSVDTLSLGVWSLKNQPVLYVCKDAKFEDNTLITFLDPSSIELMLNKDNALFDYDEIDSVKLVAYDFAFVDGSYDFSTQPYYNYYGIPQDAINASTTIKGGLDDKDFLLVDTASYQTFTKNGIKYTGVSSTALVDAGLRGYNMVYSPKISASASSPVLNTISVAVVLEISFKNGEKRVYAERFLPQIKTFTYKYVAELMRHIQHAEAPSIEGIHTEYPLFDLQKAKALRLLYAVQFPVVVWELTEFGQTLQKRGILLYPRLAVMADDNGAKYLGREVYPSLSTLSTFHSDLSYNLLGESINFDQLNSRLAKLGIPSLDNCLLCQENGFKTGFNVETGELCADNAELFVYSVDDDGNVSTYPITE